MKRMLMFLLVVLLFGCAEDNSSKPDVVIDPPPGPTVGWLHLQWTPPTENTDGSVLTDLDGYNIYYGTSPGFYDQTVAILNEGLTEYIVEPVPGGFTYYVVITAFNEAGSESEYSNMVSKTIP